MGSWWNPQFQLCQALSRSESATAILFSAYNKLFILLLILLHTSGNSIQPGKPYTFSSAFLLPSGKNLEIQFQMWMNSLKDIWSATKNCLIFNHTLSTSSVKLRCCRRMKNRFIRFKIVERLSDIFPLQLPIIDCLPQISRNWGKKDESFHDKLKLLFRVGGERLHPKTFLSI
jgi:hypothetical protein